MTGGFSSSTSSSILLPRRLFAGASRQAGHQPPTRARSGGDPFPVRRPARGFHAFPSASGGGRDRWGPARPYERFLPDWPRGSSGVRGRFFARPSWTHPANSPMTDPVSITHDVAGGRTVPLQAGSHSRRLGDVENAGTHWTAQEVALLLRKAAFSAGGAVRSRRRRAFFNGGRGAISGTPASFRKDRFRSGDQPSIGIELHIGSAGRAFCTERVREAGYAGPVFKLLPFVFERGQFAAQHFEFLVCFPQIYPKLFSRRVFLYV